MLLNFTFKILIKLNPRQAKRRLSKYDIALQADLSYLVMDITFFGQHGRLVVCWCEQCSNFRIGPTRSTYFLAHGNCRIILWSGMVNLSVAVFYTEQWIRHQWQPNDLHYSNLYEYRSTGILLDTNKCLQIQLYSKMASARVFTFELSKNT